MTRHELSRMLEDHQSIEWKEEKNCFLFRNTSLQGYKKGDVATKMKKDSLDKISVDDLLLEINRGMNVVGITRVTGYFSLVSGWNPGKLAELKDRHREGVV